MTALHVITFFAENVFFFATRFGTDFFMVVERSKDITYVKLLQSLVAKISNVNVNRLLFTCEINDASFAYLREMLPFLLNIL